MESPPFALEELSLHLSLVRDVADAHDQVGLRLELPDHLRRQLHIDPLSAGAGPQDIIELGRPKSSDSIGEIPERELGSLRRDEVGQLSADDLGAREAKQRLPGWIHVEDRGVGVHLKDAVGSGCNKASEFCLRLGERLLRTRFTRPGGLLRGGARRGGPSEGSPVPQQRNDPGGKGKFDRDAEEETHETEPSGLKPDRDGKDREQRAQADDDDPNHESRTGDFSSTPFG